MSARNRLENKVARREQRALKRMLNFESNHAQATTKYGICQVTGRWLPVDTEHNICEPAWIQIARFTGGKVGMPAPNRETRRRYAA